MFDKNNCIAATKLSRAIQLIICLPKPIFLTNPQENDCVSFFHITSPRLSHNAKRSIVTATLASTAWMVACFQSIPTSLKKSRDEVGDNSSIGCANSTYNSCKP